MLVEKTDQKMILRVETNLYKVARNGNEKAE